MTRRARALLMLFCWLLVLCAELAALERGQGQWQASGVLKGADYVYFHNGGALYGSGDIYSPGAFTARLREHYGASDLQALYPPLHPPPMFLLFAPLSALPLEISLAVATIVFSAAWLGGVYLLWRFTPSLRAHPWYFFVLGVGFPPLTVCLQTGHPSLLFLPMLVGSYLLHQRGRPLLAGGALSLLLIKPNYYVLAMAVLVCAGYLHVVFGMLLGALTIVVLTGVPDGFALWRHWLPMLTNYAQGVAVDAGFERQYSIRSFVVLLTGDHHWLGALLGAGCCVLPGIERWRSKHEPSLTRFWGCLALALILANPHIYEYDLVLLFLPLTIATDHLFRAGVTARRQLAVWLIASGFFALSATTAAQTHVQFAVPLLLLVLLWSALRLPPSAETIVERVLTRRTTA